MTRQARWGHRPPHSRGVGSLWPATRRFALVAGVGWDPRRGRTTGAAPPAGPSRVGRDRQTRREARRTNTPSARLVGGAGEAGKVGGAFAFCVAAPPTRGRVPVTLAGGSFRRPRRGACGTPLVGGPATPTSLCSPGHPYAPGWVGPRPLSAWRVWLATLLASGTRPYLLSKVGGAARGRRRWPCTASEPPLGAVLVTRPAASSFLHRPPPPASFRLLPPLPPTPPLRRGSPRLHPPPHLVWRPPYGECSTVAGVAPCRRRSAPLTSSPPPPLLPSRSFRSFLAVFFFFSGGAW